MPDWIETPREIEAHGSPPKVIREFVGPMRTGDKAFSVARMNSPAGWSEPGQCPEFDEVTVVLDGEVHVTHDGGVQVVEAGQAIVCRMGEHVRYATPRGAEYLAFCVPGFDPSRVNRDPS